MRIPGGYAVRCRRVLRRVRGGRALRLCAVFAMTATLLSWLEGPLVGVAAALVLVNGSRLTRLARRSSRADDGLATQPHSPARMTPSDG